MSEPRSPPLRLRLHPHPLLSIRRNSVTMRILHSSRNPRGGSTQLSRTLTPRACALDLCALYTVLTRHTAVTSCPRSMLCTTTRESEMHLKGQGGSSWQRTSLEETHSEFPGSLWQKNCLRTWGRCYGVFWAYWFIDILDSKIDLEYLKFCFGVCLTILLIVTVKRESHRYQCCNPPQMVLSHLELQPPLTPSALEFSVTRST